jgi:uncharacterized protein YlxW (UPF0749 family)
MGRAAALFGWAMLALCVAACDDTHINTRTTADEASADAADAHDRLDKLEHRVDQLESEVSDLKSDVSDLKQKTGLP